MNPKTLEKLDLNLEKDDINLPIVILEGSADIYDSENTYINSEESFKTIIGGVGACSENILINNLCRYLNDYLDICNESSFKEESENLVRTRPLDYACYESCNIIYNLDGVLVNQYWQGPPCERVRGYIEDESKVINSQCYGKNSCKSQDDDLGCCLQSQCVNDGRCYDSLTALDTDSDGQKEVCVNINNSGVWVNADIGKEICNANFKWFDCTGNECKQGVDNYDNKENGLCCGDDKKEEID